MSTNELQAAADQYRSLLAEKRKTAELIKDLMTDLKGSGYDIKIFKKVVAALESGNTSGMDEEQVVFDLYLKDIMGTASASE